jgi:hypothetical protein
MRYWQLYFYNFIDLWSGDNLKFTYVFNNLKNIYWQFFYLGCCFDEIFARILENLWRKALILPAILIFDRWLLLIMGPTMVKNILRWCTSSIFTVRTNFLSLLNMLLISSTFLFIILEVIAVL